MSMPRRRHTKPTLKDIAARADVSAATVSIVLKDRHTSRVSQAKRDEILRITADLNYRPNQIARALKARESRTIGLVVNTLMIPFYAEFAQDILVQAKNTGYSVLISSTQELRQSPEHRIQEERLLIHNLVDRGVDGLIMSSALREDPVVAELQEINFPFVLALRDVQRGPKDPRIDYIGIDNQRGGYLAAEHLLKSGYRHIAVITGDMQTLSAHDRLAGSLQACADWGVTIPRELILDGGYRREMARAIAVELVTRAHAPRAILSHSDHMAMGVLEALHEKGLRVPEEMAVVGFDDIEMAAMPGIGLTTVAQQKATIGKLAVDMLIDRIKSPNEHLARRVILDPVLIVRRTCGGIRENSDGSETMLKTA